MGWCTIALPTNTHIGRKLYTRGFFLISRRADMPGLIRPQVTSFRFRSRRRREGFEEEESAGDNLVSAPPSRGGEGSCSRHSVNDRRRTISILNLTKKKNKKNCNKHKLCRFTLAVVMSPTHLR
jgi:hypothetical protein